MSSLRPVNALSTARRFPLRLTRLETKAGLSPTPRPEESSALFSDISRTDLARILSAAQCVTVGRQETIFRSGEDFRQVMLLTQGSIKVSQIDENGSAVILRLVGPGEVLGPIGDTRCGCGLSTAEAREACHAYVWSTFAFEAMSEQYPVFRRNSIRILAKCLSDLETRFREISTEPVARRLAREVTRLLPRVGRKLGDGEIEINLSREELAQMTGTTLFTVSRVLSRWEQREILGLRRLAVVVRDPIALATMADSKQDI